MVTGRSSRSGATRDEPVISAGLSHAAFFYRGQRDYLAQIRAFTCAALDNGEAMFIAVPGRNGGLLREHIGADSRRVHYADMTQLGRNPARIIPEVRAFADGYPGQRIRYVGEPIWPGRSAAEMCEAARYEALVNLAFGQTAVTILCPYDAAGLPLPVIREAERTHPAILTDGQPEPAARYAGPGNVPADCDRPLPPPPAAAEALGYEADLRPIRRLVTSHATRAGLPEERAMNLVLAASELAANTLRHTRGGGTVHIWHTEAEVLCQVQDTGWITDPLAGRVRRPPDERGHGLWVVNQVCDLVELRTGRSGTTVRLHMRLPER
jgi:anti-sigma regulatory factor (Ser/Thr protein kinase)